jgi:hypothetical protein
MRALALVLWMAGLAHAASYFAIVSGLGGEPEYEGQFKRWATDLEQALKANGPDCHIETLAGAAATRQNILEMLNRVAGQTRSDDSFALILIGHGTYDGTDYKFNVPGRDVTASDLASALNHIAGQRQLVVDATSASGAVLPVLAKADRIVVTATKSGTEKNATIFARYWIDALRNPAADSDKNGTISALEAFRYAEAKTAEYFKSEKLIATEHAMLSDTGSKEGVRDPKPENGQGMRAAAFALVRPPSQAKASNQGTQNLLTKKEELEAAIDKLKYQKAAMPPDEYKRQLSALLLQLARTQAEIDQ